MPSPRDNDTVFSPVSPQDPPFHPPTTPHGAAISPYEQSRPTDTFISIAPSSPITAPTPITNYSEKPHEAPEALTPSTSAKLDPAAHAPEVVQVDRSPPVLVKYHEPSFSTASTSTTLTSSPQDTGNVYPKTLSVALPPADPEAGKGSLPPRRRRRPASAICGLRPRTFYILLAVGLTLLLGGIIGGAIGGTVGRRNTSSDRTSSASDSNTFETDTDTPTPTRPPSPLITGWNLTLHSERNLTGASHTFTYVGLYAVFFPPPNNISPTDPAVLIPDILSNTTNAQVNITKANSYEWMAGDSGCCVKFCRDTEDVGYRCATNFAQPKPRDEFNKVFLQCNAGGEPSAEYCLGEGMPMIT